MTPTQRNNMASFNQMWLQKVLKTNGVMGSRLGLNPVVKVKVRVKI